MMHEKPPETPKQKSVEELTREMQTRRVETHLRRGREAEARFADNRDNLVRMHTESLRRLSERERERRVAFEQESVRLGLAKEPEPFVQKASDPEAGAAFDGWDLDTFNAFTGGKKTAAPVAKPVAVKRPLVEFSLRTKRRMRNWAVGVSALAVSFAGAVVYDASHPNAKTSRLQSPVIEKMSASGKAQIDRARYERIRNIPINK